MWVQGAVSLIVKRQAREADHSAPSKNGGAILPVPPYVFMAWCVVNLKPRDTFNNKNLWAVLSVMSLGLCVTIFESYRQSAGLLGSGISPPPGNSLHKHKINADKHPWLEWDSNP
jgi:hypothetical protein